MTDPVISAVSVSYRNGDRRYTITLPDDSRYEVDVTEYKRDQVLIMMYLEEQIFKLIDDGNAPPNAVVRLY